VFETGLLFHRDKLTESFNHNPDFEIQRGLAAFKDALVSIESITVSTTVRNYAAIDILDLRNNILVGIARLPIIAPADKDTHSGHKRKRYDQGLIV
jgi:dihydroxyacetone kinase-like predicted kinase